MYENTEVMKKIVVVLIVAFQFMSCNSKQKEERTQTPVIQDTIGKKVENNSSNVVAIYEGLLPCADCEGIETVLKIDEGNGTMEDHKFELTSVYKGKQPENKFTEKGNFNTERGLEEDPDGTIYILNWNKSEADQIYYGRYSDKPEKLYMLDRERKIIKSKLDYSLTLKK